jgi:type I restriction enzyme S subunit
MRFGLEENIIKKIAQVFEANLKVDKALVFGSRAKGNWRSDSDIDIAIKSFDITMDDILKMSVAFEEKGIKYNIELIDYFNINEKALVEHIDRVGIEFYSRRKNIMLQDVVSKLGDGLHGTPEYDVNGNYYFINGNNLVDGKIVIKKNTPRVSEKEYLKYKKELNDRTILLGINGTIGNVALYNGEKCILGKSACYFNVINSVNKDYIKYVITDKTFQSYIENFANGSTIMNVSLKTVREYEFSLPPIQEQITIAYILSSLDDKIDLLHRQNKTLEQLAKTLFRQWFVEKAAENWEEITLSEIAEHKKGNINPAKNPDKLYKHYSLPSFDELKEPVVEIGKDILSNKYKAVSNSILVSKLNPRTPRIWMLYGRINEDECICSTEFQVVKPKSNIWLGFIYCFLKSNQVTQELAGASGGTSGSHQRINPQDIFNLRLFKPSENLVERFDNITNNYWGKIRDNQTQIHTLTQLRDTLLPKLISGEVRVNLKN